VGAAAPAARKRNRARDDAPSPSSSSFPLYLTSSAPVSRLPSFSFGRGDANATRSPPPRLPCRDGASPAAAPDGAARVSPFPVRLPRNVSAGGPLFEASPPPRLDPVPEEAGAAASANASANDDAHFHLSQSSAASSLTFGTATGSSARMMDWGDEDIEGESCNGYAFRGGNDDDGDSAMIGTVVAGGLYKSPPSSHDIVTTGGSDPMGYTSPLHMSESPPPAKRARRNSQPAPLNEEMAFEVPSSIFSSRRGGLGLKMNIDKPQGMCCHVCSKSGANVKSNDDANALSVASRHESSDYPGVEEPSAAPALRSRSLLDYYRSTPKKPASCQRNKFHVKAASQPAVPSPSTDLPPCGYCDRPTCRACSRHCEFCRRRFCTFCTKVDYESGVAERVLCFECDETAGRWKEGDDNASAVGGDCADCDLMDL
ncbi:hypothetical protein ACHAWF_004438, partial [Thalassiosira exigua]